MLHSSIVTWVLYLRTRPRKINLRPASWFLTWFLTTSGKQVVLISKKVVLSLSRLSWEGSLSVNLNLLPHPLFGVSFPWNIYLSVFRTSSSHSHTGVRCGCAIRHMYYYCYIDAGMKSTGIDVDHTHLPPGTHVWEWDSPSPSPSTSIPAPATCPFDAVLPLLLSFASSISNSEIRMAPFISMEWNCKQCFVRHPDERKGTSLSGRRTVDTPS